MKKFLYKTYNPHIRSIQEVVEHMSVLQEELDGTDTQNLQAFNHTYWIISKNVLQKFGSSYFMDEDTMNTVDVNFGYLYFDSMKKYIDGGSPPPAWKTLFSLCKQNIHYQYIYMALGVNARVNNDLGLALHYSLVTPSFRSDYDKINTIIHRSLREVISSLKEKQHVIKTSQTLLLPTYKGFLNTVIKNWRENAWKDYERPRIEAQTKSEIERKAGKIAEVFAETERIHDLHRLRKILL